MIRPLITPSDWSKVSPQIYFSPRNKSVSQGHPVNFSCKATGVPKPTFSWTYNDGDLPSGIHETSHGDESFLEFPNTTKSMEGIYKCTAENKAHTTTSSAYLHVFGKQIENLPYSWSLIAVTTLRDLNSFENTIWRNSGLYGIWTHNLLRVSLVLSQLSYLQHLTNLIHSAEPCCLELVKIISNSKPFPVNILFQSYNVYMYFGLPQLLFYVELFFISLESAR